MKSEFEAEDDSQSLLPEGCMRVGPVCGLPGLLRENGVDPIRVVGRLGLSLAVMKHPNRILPVADVGRLLRHGAAETGCS